MNSLPPLVWWFQSCARCFLFPHIFAALLVILNFTHWINSTKQVIYCPSCAHVLVWVDICFRWHSEKRWLFPFIMDWTFTRELRKSVLVRSVSLVSCLKPQFCVLCRPTFLRSIALACLLTAYVHVACSVAMRGKTWFSFLPVVTMVKCTIDSRMRMFCYK